MKKGLLLCAGGMSTTMMAKGLNKDMDGEMTWDAMGVSGSSDYQSLINDYDFIFVSPQIRFMYDEIKENVEDVTNGNVPVVQIQPQQYIVIKTPELAGIVREELGM